MEGKLWLSGKVPCIGDLLLERNQLSEMSWFITGESGVRTDSDRAEVVRYRA